MSRIQRAGLLALTAVVLAAAFLVLRPDNDDHRGAAATDMTTTSPATAPAAPPDPGPLLTAGHVRTITVRRGERVRFRVRSASPEEVHVHGYDLLRRVPAGRTVRISFKADLEGVFEIELERSGTPVAKLKVEP